MLCHQGLAITHIQAQPGLLLLLLVCFIFSKMTLVGKFCTFVLINTLSPILVKTPIKIKTTEKLFAYFRNVRVGKNQKL